MDQNRQICAFDWQWMGVGSPAIDVVHYLSTSVRVEVLSKIKQLMSLYHSTLLEAGVENYPFQTFKKQFQVKKPLNCHGYK